MTKSCAQVEAILDTLVKVTAALKGSGVPFALTGGSAVYALGGVPSEHDVDVAVRETDVERAVSTLVEAGMQEVATPLDWLRKVRDDGRTVDLIFRSINCPVDGETLASANDVKVGPIVVPVLPATTVMIYKLLVFGEHFCDYTWALPAARALREQIDWDRVRAEVSHSPFAEAFLLLADRLGLSSPPKGGPMRVAGPVKTQPVKPQPVKTQEQAS